LLKQERIRITAAREEAFRATALRPKARRSETKASIDYWCGPFKHTLS